MTGRTVGDDRGAASAGEPDAFDRLAAAAYASTLDSTSEPAAVGGALGLGAAVLDAALTARPRGGSLASPAAPAGTIELFGGAIDDVERLAGALADAQLTATTWLGHDVRSVLAHLCGQLDRLADRLAGSPDPDPDYEHWAATAPQRAALAHAGGEAIARHLRIAGDRVLAALRGSGLAGPVEPAAEGPVERAVDVQAKAFETWMHADDVRLALGHPVTDPGPAAVLALCTLATALVPAGMHAVGRSHPGRTVRIVLTGAGGGTWRSATAPGESAAAGDDAVLVADAVTFCRLFHRQVDAATVPLHVEGDAELVDDVLAGAQAFAERT